MALLGFIFSSLYLSQNVSPYGWGLFPCMSEREREEERRRRKKPIKNHFAITWIWTHGLCLQSRAWYPLGHGALPKDQNFNFCFGRRISAPKIRNIFFRSEIFCRWIFDVLPKIWVKTLGCIHWHRRQSLARRLLIEGTFALASFSRLLKFSFKC